MIMTQIAQHKNTQIGKHLTSQILHAPTPKQKRAIELQYYGLWFQ